MGVVEQIEKDFLAAMKNREPEKVSVLRLVKAAFGNYAIEKKKNRLEDAEALDVLQKQAKQRRESVESYEKAGRPELAEKERQELNLLQTYLPKQLSDEEIGNLARSIIESVGAKSKADQEKVMKELMPALRGKADGKRVNEILAALLK